MDIKQIGTWMGGRRKELGLTQADLGANLCYTPQAISLIEQGKTCMLVSTLYQLAAVLRCSPEDILSCSERVSEDYHEREFVPEDFAANLKKYRKVMGKKQSELAEVLGVSARTLRTYEKDKATPNIEFLVRFMDLTGTTLADLEAPTVRRIRSSTKKEEVNEA